ncbi:TetR/AcrR family transcriptional regulator [Leeia sp. TBRC 13508]|uniref:TetR/AcrR family transcriptional regulator n=1 Tax=Leeia speluncae TaxID=2884804 RepID=A0ABS8DBM2_9NEIS|nr:TetR/AcrR family transcriptional regulator [Leeia speluncae]MCB6185398.1 TetR/AcrR family transcriptional regulator [Leeia speluncae]
MPASKKKQLLLETALSLFMKEGFLAVGIDRILAESGVAKMTLYKHFPTKQALILETLEYRDHQFFQSLQQYADTFSIENGDRLKAIFNWHLDWVNSASYRGCAFVGAAVAFPESTEKAHQLAAKHKQKVLTYIAASLPLQNGNSTANEIMLMLEGAIVLSQIHANAEPMKQAIEWLKNKIT